MTDKPVVTSMEELMVFVNTFYNENEMKKRRVLTHQITFDENTEVYLIGNDCNCNFWNSLGYRF